MRPWLAGAVIVFGIVVVGAGAVAMYTHAIIADETGVSGWNPALWLVLLSGIAVFLIGIAQFALAVGDTASRRSESN